MANLISVKVPDIGDFKNVGIIEVLVKPGDKVNKEQSLITLESDKASIEIPAPEAGVVKELKVKIGDKVSEGDVILMLEATGATETKKATPVAQSSSTAPAVKPVKVPDIGDFKNVGIIEVLVKAGDKVNKEQSLITLESDKASIEIPAPEAGVIKELKVKVGDKVSEGDLILMLEATGTAESKKAAPAAQAPAKSASIALQAQRPAPAAPRSASAAPATLPAIDEANFGKAHASPSIRKFARELGADLGRIQGTGPKSRILREDILNYVKRILSGAATVGGGMPGVSPPPKVDFASFGPVETQPLSNINKLTGKYLHSSWFHIPHVTQFDEADITELEAFRKKISADKNVKITMVAFLVKAVVAGLKEFPRFNASLDPGGESLVFKKYFHVGVAVDTPDGLVVPVIRDADRKSLAEVATEIADLATRARQKKVKPAEMQGGCFTISSLGGVGGTAFTPIVNQPEVAILGVSRSSMKPVYQNNAFVPRLMLPLSLSYDHRVIDGVLAAKFTTFLNQLLADVQRLSK